MGLHLEQNRGSAECDQQTDFAPDDSAHESDITILVKAAQAGNGLAWEELIRRFNPLVLSVIKNYRLSCDDSQDVRQTVWLQLYENIGRLREPRALPGWIRTTTRNEALHQVNRAGRYRPMDPAMLATLPNQQYDPEIDGELLRFERDRAIHDGLTEIEPRQRRLLLLLHAEDKPSYRDIGRVLGIPTGSIGPNRARYLKKLRDSRALSTFLLSGSEEEFVAVG